MNRFKLKSTFVPTGDQPQAIEGLVNNLAHNTKEQILLGVTGSGKTYTLAKVIEAIQKPTLIMSHNKTLAAQLYQEFRDFFPDNAVSYFVSYYDYYQPEAYIPQTNTYIEKETQINEEIDKLRLAATTNILTRKDTIIVASVSGIYNIGSPREYEKFALELQPGIPIDQREITTRLVQLQYERNDYDIQRGTFRVRGNVIDIYPAYEDIYIRVIFDSNGIEALQTIHTTTGDIEQTLPYTFIFPAKHYITDTTNKKEIYKVIEDDMSAQVDTFTKQGKLIEAQRIRERVTYDLEMIQEIGYVNGIENYSRYFDGRAPGAPPYTLFDYYKEAVNNDWLLCIDESHMSIPQIRGMYQGDRSRKQTLIDYGFRLPAALDNRPLRFEEFLRRIPQTIYVSATPDDWEISRVVDSATKKQGIVEQLIRPTGLVDPEIHIYPTKDQIQHLIKEISTRVKQKERVLVTTLTKRMAEDLATYLEEQHIKVHYLHSDIDTLKRTDLLTKLREGVYDVVVGINLLREGLDLPEVSLVAILDADKEGFLRSKTSLIQTMGRAARHERGTVFMYADKKTRSMKAAIQEVSRRRNIQLRYNKKHNITPSSIQKPIRKELVRKTKTKESVSVENSLHMTEEEVLSLTPKDTAALKKKLDKAMKKAAKELNFELAVEIRDFLKTL